MNLQTIEEEFWNWFSANQNQFLAFEGDQDPILVQLAEKLSAIHPDLRMEFGPVTVKQDRVLCLSANGIEAAVPFVTQLIQQAPTLPGFNLVAFRQRQNNFEKQVRIGDKTLGYEDIYFLYAEEGKQIGVSLYIRGYEEDNPGFEQAVFILLDSLIGELELMKMVAWLEWNVLEEEKVNDYSPILELVELVDGLKPNQDSDIFAK